MFRPRLFFSSKAVLHPFLKHGNSSEDRFETSYHQKTDSPKKTKNFVQRKFQVYIYIYTYMYLEQ